MKNSYIKKFEANTAFLTKNELEVLNLLVSASEEIAELYSEQLAQGFYPATATKQEIEKAASNDPSILSPYTMVERDHDGKLVAVPYSIKFRNKLESISGKLLKASEVSGLPEDFRKALTVQAKALLSDEYDETQSAWMKIKPYIIDIVIGPIERVEDTLFFVKRSYQAWVGIMDKVITGRSNTLKDVVFSARREVLATEKVDFMQKAQLRADNTIIFAGMIANYGYTATTLPNDIDLLEKVGSEAWLFLPSIKTNFEKKHFKIFEKIFAPFFKKNFTSQQLYRGYLLQITMHEIARIAVRYRFATDRLREYYPVFNELATELLAVKMSGMLLLKDIISQEEMEAVLVMFLTRLFDGYTDEPDTKKGFDPLVAGNAVLMNSLIGQGAVRVTEAGISWPNFTKMFFAVSNIAEAMEKIMAEGTYNDAQSYLHKHSSLVVFKNFSQSIKTLQS